MSTSGALPRDRQPGRSTPFPTLGQCSSSPVCSQGMSLLPGAVVPGLCPSRGFGCRGVLRGLLWDKGCFRRRETLSSKSLQLEKYHGKNFPLVHPEKMKEITKRRNRETSLSPKPPLAPPIPAQLREHGRAEDPKA